MMKFWGSIIILAVIVGGSYIWSGITTTDNAPVNEPTVEQTTSDDWFPEPVEQSTETQPTSQERPLW